MLNQLEQIRISKGVDKKYLCEKAGITRANYDHAIRRNDIKISKFFALCEVLQVTLTIKIKDNEME